MAPLNFVLRQEHGALTSAYRVLAADVQGLRDCIEDPSTATPSSVLLLNDIKLGLPPSWVSLIPALGVTTNCSIAPWLNNIQRRHIQIQEWLAMEKHLLITTHKDGPRRSSTNDLAGLTHRLESYNLGLFFNPQGFLVALRQEVVRLKRAQGTKAPWSVEDTRLKTKVLRPNNKSGGKLAMPLLGTNLCGLTMEGAAWDGLGLVEQGPQEDVTVMPIVAVSVVHARSVQFDGRSYHCPVYRCSGNRDASTQAFEILLPTDVNADHWTLRGTALFLGRKLD